MTKDDVDKLIGYFRRPFPKQSYFITSISDGIAEELELEPGLYELVLEEKED